MWGALGSIGNFFGGLGKSIGGGLGKVGSGIVKGGQKLGGEFKERIGEMREGMDDDGQMPTLRQPSRVPMTPGFNPGASMPKLGDFRLGQNKGDTSAIGQPSGDNEPPRLPMPTLSPKPPMPLTPTQQSGHPPLTDFDTDTGRMIGSPPAKMPPPLTGVNPISGQMGNEAPTIRDSVEITDTAPRLAPSPVPPMAAPQTGAPRDTSFDSREGVPLPGRPNRGGPVPWSPYEQGKYDAWAKHAKRDADGNFDPNGGTKRNWKSILQNALAGAASQSQGGDLGRMIGGAIGGGAGATVNPQAGYEHIWDVGHGARMMEDQARRDAEVERQRKLRMGGLAEREANADVGLKENALKRAQGRRIGEATWGTYDQETGQPIWQRPAGQSTQARPRLYNVNGALVNEAGQVVYQGQSKPMTMQDAEADRAAEEGSAEEIAQSSFNDPGRQQAIFNKLPKQYQDALRSSEPNLASLPTQYQQALANPGAFDAETVTKAEQARNAMVERHNQLRIAAQNELQQLQQRELADIRRYTEQEARKKAGARRTGGASRPASSGSGNGPRAKLSDLKKYLQ